MNCDQILSEISKDLLEKIAQQEKKIQELKDKNDFNSNIDLATAIGKHLALMDTHNLLSVLMTNRANEIQKQNIEALKHE